MRGHDLLSDEIWLPLLRRVKNGEFTYLFLSPPCETFSRAPWSNSHGPAPLRSADWPEGFPWLRGSNKVRVETGTELVRRCLHMVSVAHEAKVHWLWEHPEDLGPTPRGCPASVWSWQESRSLFDRLQVSTVALYQCAFGEDYRKPTRLAGTWANLPALGFSGWPQFNGLRYVGPLPKKCGHQHPSLIGLDSGGQFRTKPTAAYGQALCKALAQSMLATPPSTSSVSSGQWVATDEAVEAEIFASGDPESAAAVLCKRGASVSFSTLLRLFELLPGEAPARGEVTSSSKSFAVGAYAVGGSLAGLRKTTKLFPSVARVLCNVVRGLDDELVFSAVGIFRNLQTSPHKDTGNQAGCENLVAALSSFKEGGIWLESSEGDVPCPFNAYGERGLVLRIPPAGYVKFNPRRRHCTMPWHGADRTVLVAYTPFCGPSLKEEDRSVLSELGFRLPGAAHHASGRSTAAVGQLKPSSRKRPAEGAALEDDNGDGTSAKSSTRKHPSGGAALGDDNGSGTSAKSSARRHPSGGAALWDDNGDGSSEWWQPSSQSTHWVQDPEGSTSEEDEDGFPVAPRGSGKLGVGPALLTRGAGKTKLYSDGHGLASPGRWPPRARPCADHDPGLAFHKSLMDQLLRFITDNVDYKKVVCFLATGKCTASPFSEAVMDQARQLVFKRIREQGSTAPLEEIPERQPFYLHAISEVLRLADDPDWRQYVVSTHSFANGVPLGVDHRMPRCPALFERKRRHRDFKGLGAHECEELRDNYRSADGFESKIETQFGKEIELGAMVELDLQEAQRRFGQELSIASLGCIPKADGSVRVVHDATHGQHVNDSIRVRDGQAYPSGADLEETLHSLPYATFSLSGDISRAHRLSKVREQDWPRQACRARKGGSVYLNTVGTFGVTSASYWWHRLMGGLGRFLYYCHGRDETTLLSYVDDLLWITQSSDGLLRILGSILLLSVLGVPFAWHKFAGGGEHTWIGYSLCVARRTVGISLSRADWIVGWIRKTRADGLVRVADLRSVLGRLSFAFSVIPLLKPFLGPMYAWVAAVQACHTLRLPKAISMVLLFLQRALEQGLRRIEVPRFSCPPKEHFRTDAKAQGSELWVGGWCCADDIDPHRCRWFSERIDHVKFPVFFMAGQSYRSIGALELLATLIALFLFEPQKGIRGINHCSAATDNRGNAFVTLGG